VRILIATTNPAKDERLRRCLSGWPFDSSGVESLLDVRPPEESGRDHREVAESKAMAWSRAAGGLAIASDGGLAIPVLGDRWDSLMTHRSAGESASDEDRVVNLLRLMMPFDGDDRRAVWREAVVLADRGVVVAAWEVEGPIGVIQRAPSPTRIEGFWAASLWHFREVGKTYTELSAEELRRVGDPWTRLTDVIQDWLRDGGWETLTEG
jgi:inosine/xanthosine triphosphate pyrophosphatase family protein